MPAWNTRLLKDFTKKVVPNVSPLSGNSIENDERVSYGLVANTHVAKSVESADWSDSIIQRCRFENTSLTNSSFERVAIIDCDLSGVTFRDCLLRDCLVTGVKAQSFLAFDNCILDRVFIARSRIEKLDVHYCQVSMLEFLGLDSEQIHFHLCKAHKRTGTISIQESEVSKMIGLPSLQDNNIHVAVDMPLWRDLGDALLKEQGIRQLEASTTSSYVSLDEIDESIADRRS